jgi:2,4-dienoyl-CoA reductase-like NADH-dependent reductase (Old Yellow Enzyme family)
LTPALAPYQHPDLSQRLIAEPPVPSTQLFTSKRIGSVHVRNRIVMPAMTTRLADREGFVTDATIAYFAARAKGGTGLITVEMAAPERVGRHRFHELGIYDDRFLPGLRRLTDAIHAHGAKASIQLGHAGGHTRQDICGEPPIAPSAVPHYVYELHGETVMPVAMSQERIARTIAAFVEAAARAKAANFDCVELHVAHGYLLSQFLCPEENQRTDEYGGTLANRARISLEILRSVRARVKRFPVIFRVNVNDYFPNGLTFPEGLQVAKWAALEGANALHITAGHYRSLPSAHMMTPPMNCPEAIFLNYAARVKSEVSVPVIAVGRLGNPQVAMEAVDSGKTDFVALGRPLIADPDWVAKARSNTAVRRCLACNRCVDEMRSGEKLGCVVNPVAARELEYARAEPLPAGQRICVIGAGPAGLSYAALVADGNRVTVFEREARSGGALRYAGYAPQFQNVEADQRALDAYLDELERACREKNVEFRFGTSIAALTDLPETFDRIIVATGATYKWRAAESVRKLLRLGFGKSAVARRLFRSARLRDWFYYRARRSTVPDLGNLDGKPIAVIGDAASPGKTRDAIESAFKAALFSAQPTRL